jgi:P27 family predicted phage terminase small subunit
MRGRKAKPVGPGVPSEAPECPAWVKGEAAAEWRRVVPMLADAGTIHRVDLAILTAYCTTFALWRQAREQVETDGLLVEGKLHPCARFADQSLKQLRGLLDQLGFTPTARKQVLQAASGDGDLLESMLQGD